MKKKRRQATIATAGIRGAPYRLVTLRVPPELLVRLQVYGTRTDRFLYDVATAALARGLDGLERDLPGDR